MPKAPNIYYTVRDQLPEDLMPERLNDVPLLEVAAYAALSAVAYRRGHKLLAAGLAVGSVVMATTPERPADHPQTVESP